jgi:hypothetical protein
MTDSPAERIAALVAEAYAIGFAAGQRDMRQMAVNLVKACGDMNSDLGTSYMSFDLRTIVTDIRALPISDGKP